MPAAVHAAADVYGAAHRVAAGTNWSAMTVEPMFLAVTHSGVKSTETLASRSRRCLKGLAVDQRCWRGDPGPSVDGESDGGLGLFVDRLVHRAALVTGEDVAQARATWRPGP